GVRGQKTDRVRASARQPPPASIDDEPEPISNLTNLFARFPTETSGVVQRLRHRPHRHSRRSSHIDEFHCAGARWTRFGHELSIRENDPAEVARRSAEVPYCPKATVCLVSGFARITTARETTQPTTRRRA